MPEGDTVYRTARRLDAALAERQLIRAELRHPRLVEHDLAGREVLAVSSVGKHLFVRLDNGRSLHSHLRMDGSWQLYRPGQRWRHAAHHARAVLATADRVAVGFRLHDLALPLTSDEHRLVGHLGPDLLDPQWGELHEAEAERRLTANPAAEIGLVLLDQRVMAGLGNVYRCEVCFLLGVSPWEPVGELANPVKVVALARTCWAATRTTPSGRRPVSCPVASAPGCTSAPAGPAGAAVPPSAELPTVMVSKLGSSTTARAASQVPRRLDQSVSRSRAAATHVRVLAIHYSPGR